MTEAEARARVEEQAHLDFSYAVLDERTKDATSRLAETARRRTSHAQNRLENEALADNLVQRLAAYGAAQRRLCFGRIDTQTGEVHHVGRIGLADDTQQRIQIDWRAPAAAAFYQATPANPSGLVRRRHIATDGRTVSGVYDDVFDAEVAGEDVVLSADGILLAALGRQRTGKMGDIVETIQAEQDAIVRSDSRGVLVVDGGPGTGKTVVALHRAAFLLYRDRERLERNGVLIIGPSSRFLTYIDDVLPGLGETGVVLATVADLFPGIDVDRGDLPATLVVKADLRMVDVIAKAVQLARRTPPNGCSISVGGDRIHLSDRFLAGAARRALHHDPRHNVARPVFITAVVNQLIDELARRRGIEVGDQHERRELFDEVNETTDARRAINLLWMPVSADQLVDRLWRDPARLRRVADRILTEDEQALLFRPRTGWSVGDIAILDEAAELLGPTGIGEPRLVSYGDDADELVDDGQVSSAASGDLSDRALSDRDWAYGHIIVDEAQELTPMQWRMLARRVPSRSMTVVGDLAQASTPGSCSSWDTALEPIAAGRWRRASLSVNYRTPASICALADRYRSLYAPVTPSRAVRDTQVEPDFVVTNGGEVEAILLLAREHAGLTAVVAPSSEVKRLRSKLTIPVLSAVDAKGLEFDNVIVVNPSAIEQEHGPAGLYVALTRPTQRLGIVSNGQLPNGLTI
jgi:DNA helicase IV